jgi:CRP-like cAMP-binding protein
LYCAIWKVLSEEQLAFMSDGTKSRKYRRGDAVYAVGDPNSGVYCISEGSLGVRKIDAEGNWILLQLAYPGETLGYRSFLRSGRHRTSAEALEPSVVCHINADKIAGLLENDPTLGLQFLQRASHEIETVHDTLLLNLTLTNRQYFVHLLMVLLKRHGSENADGSFSIQLPLSRRDLASMVGTRQETISRIIKRLENDGLATFSGRRVHITDVDALFDEISAYFPAP